MIKMYKYILLSLFIIIFLSGCSSLLHSNQLFSSDPIQHTLPLEEFLENGWDFYNYKGKVVLIKYSDNKIKIHDFFGVLGE